jgi:hypothetical protein
MRNRVTKLAAALAALAALAAGGAAFASGAGKGSSPAPTVAFTHHGGQATDEPSTEPADNEAASESADTDNVQQGDQATPDTAGSSQEEQAAESSDGPGGYADTSPDANTQQEGEH